ncbi:MAG: ThuA domain-containing protein [Verrucomicrobiota bacterium]
MKLFPLFVVCFAGVAAHAIEPWADTTLPVKEGLALWLDANAEIAAAKADGAIFENGNIPRGMWHDGSGNKRNARQENETAQPRFGVAYPKRIFSFDGQSQNFVVKSPGLQLKEATVLVFARAKSNAGGFRGLLSASKTGANDFQTGFNIDLGSKASDAGLGALNVEGAGFAGEQNLLKEPVELGATFSVLTRFAHEKVTASLSSMQSPSRPRAEGSVLHGDEIVIGSRNYGINGGTPEKRGFFHGDVFEVLVYDRVLNDDEVRAMRTYLNAKYSSVVFVAPAKSENVSGAAALAAVKNPPVIQPLVPGFTTRKLPVSLSNINFLRYHRDGRLFAGAYDGKIYTLRDTDGDGLEDKAELFYSSDDLKVVMGMALTPPNYPLGDGVFVSTRGRILLILDKHHTGKGDEVITVAQGWEPPKVAAGGVSDALGVAVAKDGRVFFNLGTPNFTNAYLLDAATGKAGYRADGERGSVQEVSADFKTRTTVANGLRFLVGLAFNRDGDLFATEQEGATWLANGNPFDELLHIQPKRYYGFPPRHPKHLPDVVDEPSTFDYGPQHQSTVGLAFDEPVNDGGAIFGPSWWRGDALVAAMSRGKIYRTKLIKTDVGYVAHNETFAQLQRIIIDQAVTPKGALTVTLHGGAPDWGTGPSGLGELWQIAPVEKAPAQPVITYSASPTEVRVVFDRPLEESALAALQGRVSVTQGRYLQAGDRFETMRPGYQVVKNQLAAPRYPVAVQKLALSEDKTTLLITTADRTAGVNYGITITSDFLNTKTEGEYGGQLDLMTDLTGLEAEWKSAKGEPINTWLPHPEFKVSRAIYPQSSLWSRVAEEGRLTLKGQLDLGLMLYPAVQEGSKLDWDYPEEKVTVVFSATRPFKVTLGKESATSTAANSRFEARVKLTSKATTWAGLTVVFDLATGDPDFKTSWFTDRSDTPRPFALRRILLPYATAQEIAPTPRNEDLPQLAGANWDNGRTLFKSICATCHTMRGEGGKVGPDLTNLIYRDYDSVLRDIREPSAAINPEHVTYSIKKKDGSELTAVWISENANTVTFGLISGQLIEIPRDQIAEQKQLATSLMPAGFDKALSPEQLRDLMSYLLIPPFEPAPLMIGGAPAPRKLSEVKAILGDKLEAPIDANAKPLLIVLCASAKDKSHIKPGYHDYPLWRSRWTRLLGMAPGIKVEQANDWPTEEQWSQADLIVFNSYNPAWAGVSEAEKIAKQGEDMDKFLARGGGITFIHYALNAGANAEALASRLGAAWKIPPAKYRHGASEWILDKTHPLAGGFDQFQIPDESYWHLTGDLGAAKANILATSVEENESTPQMWTREVGPGRVFVSVPGHFTWTHDDPLYRILILRGLMWTAKEPLDRLAPLSVIGARVEK